MKVKLKFIPFPADVTVLPEEVYLLVIDSEDQYHIASRVGEEIEVVQEDYEGAPDEIDIKFVAILPAVELASDID